jgi:hypothetical protein
MLGNNDIKGLSVLTIQDIFDFIRRDSHINDYDVTITYVEIYNETIRDLLVPHSGYLELRDDPIKVNKLQKISIKKNIKTYKKGNTNFRCDRIQSRIC